MSCLEELGFSTQPAGRVLPGELGMFVQHGRGQRARPVQQVAVGGQVGKAQQGSTGLARAQELAGPAYLKVAPGNLETVGRFRHGLQASLGRLAQPAAFVGRVQQHAGRRRSPGPPARAAGAACDRPKRSACSITISDALGTSTPTSITVVLTSTPICPIVKSAITAFFSAGGMRECSSPTITPGSAVAQTLHGSAWHWSGPAPRFLRSADKPSTPAGLAPAGADPLDHSSRRLSDTSFVTTGVRPGGSSSITDTSRSA
jgi:hypothetical protein